MGKYVRSFAPATSHYYCSFLLIFISFIIFSSCGETTPVKTEDEEQKLVPGGKTLTIIGPAILRLTKKGKIDLEVMLTQENVGPLPGEQISYQVIGNPAGSALTKTSNVTNEHGISSTTLNCGDQNAEFQIRVTSMEASSITYSIIVEPLTKLVSLLNGTIRTAYTYSKIILPVQITDKYGIPLRGMAISFQLVGQSHGGASLTTNQTITGPGGIGKTYFVSGDKKDFYRVLVKVSETEDKEFEITVNERKGKGGICQNDAECNVNFLCNNGLCEEKNFIDDCNVTSCAAGFTCNKTTKVCTGGVRTCVYDLDCQSDELCDSGICNTKGGQGTSCMDQNQCAKGYICQGGECYLHFVPVGGGGSQDTCKTDTDCPSGSQCLNNQCIPNNSCLHDADCPPGHYCDMGLCRKMPETDPHKDGVIDVSGMWYTQYSFDMTNALIGFPKLGGPLDKLDQLFKNGFNLKNKIPIIGDIIDKAVANYLKSRFKSGIPEVITALNNIANMLQTWKAKGEMQLRHLNPRNKISGTENWNSLILYWIDQCPMGRADPNYPQCAELDVGFKHADVKIEVFPFTGSVSGNTFNMDNRKIKMEVNKLISYLVNLVIKVTTGHPDLKTMLKKSIDCTEVQKAVEGLACSIGYCGSLQFVQIACNQAKDPVADLIGAKIDSLKSSDNVLEFSGYAQIVSDNNQPPQSLEMKNGVLNGKAKVVSSGKTTGDWSATR